LNVTARPIEHNLTKKELREMEPRSFLIRTITGLVLLFFAIILIGILFKPYFEVAGDWMVEHLGYIGVFFFTIFLDTFWLPASPDVLLLFSVAGDMNPYLTLITVSIGSIIGGHFAYLLGMWIGHLQWIRRIMGRNYEKGVYLAQKYGMWAVVLGAAAPPPFSLTCWFAGIFRLKYKKFLYATLWRIPKFLMTYLFIKLGFGLNIF
jgi:membrane protein YqaA with SNARE-associated domain